MRLLPSPHTRMQAREAIVIAVVALLSFLPFLGAAPLFDWDEINFAESAREMMVSGNYFQVQVNYQPFWEKPPLFIWMQVASMKLFGVGEFAARLPNALVGVLTLLCLYWAGTRLRDTRLGLLLAGLYFVSFLPFLYFKSGIIDPTFNLFIFLGLFQILLHEHERAAGTASGRRPVYAGLFTGLATLTKGPVAMLVTVLAYFIFKLIHERRMHWPSILLYVGVYLGVILSWFGSLVLFTPEGVETVRKFIVYQVELFLTPVAGHEQPFYYHFVIFALGCFPLSAFAVRGMLERPEAALELRAQQMMRVLFWVVLILFTIVRTKIVHYSSLAYFPGVVLAGLELDRMVRERRALRWDQVVLLGAGFLLFGVGSMLVGLIPANLDLLRERATGAFARANLDAEVAWTGLEFLPGCLWFAATALAGYFFLRRRHLAGVAVMAVAMPFYANGVNALILPRVADYSQNAAIRFFQSKAEEDAYMMVEGYKSYAHYFYARIRPFPHPEIPEEKRGDWMARGPVDKPVYLVTRIDRVTEEFERVWFEKFVRVGQEAGFVFYRREPEIQDR